MVLRYKFHIPYFTLLGLWVVKIFTGDNGMKCVKGLLSVA